MRVKILNFNTPDNIGDVFIPEGVEVPTGKVYVSLDNGENPNLVLGLATLEKDAQGLWADITPMTGRKDLLMSLYPSICGIAYERRGHVINRCEIKSVGVHLAKNSDPTIETIGVQLEELSKVEGA